MAASFAAYASQYLNRQQNAASTMADSSQPMFFSFTTDDGSRHGAGLSADLDDLDDPHLRNSEMSAGLLDFHNREEEEGDPYLRLDEDEHVGIHGQQRRQQQQQSAPLLAGPRSSSPESPQGWLAHLAHSPRKSPSPVPSSSSESSPPADLFVAPPAAKHAMPQGQVRTQAPVPAPPPPPHSLSLTDSLLPRDGFSRPIDIFTLPDPRHTPRKRRKHHDSVWISLWLGLVTVCLFFSILLLFTTRRPKEVPSVMLPYTVLLRTVPMLVILTVLSAAAAYVHVYLLKIFVKPVMIATSVFIPATLFISAVCAFVGSFMWDGDAEPTWGETVGLRLFAIIPLVLSLITARRLLHLPRQIHTTSSTLTLSTHLLINNLFVLALSPAILVAMLLGSIPFVTLIFRLLLVGYSTKVGQSGFEWHVRAWANWAIVGSAAIWFWSWAVARGVLRMTCASVIGAWYFADPSAPLPPATSTHTIHAALVRSTGPSLGSIVLASLILTLLRLLMVIALLLRRLPSLLLRIPWVPLNVPIAFYVVPGVQWLVLWLETKSGTLSRYALVYGGLTGAGFWESAVRGRELVSGVEGPMVGHEDDEDEQNQRQESGSAKKARRGQRDHRPTPNPKKRNFGSEPPLALLTISPLTLSFPFALMTYLFVAHTIGAPKEALGAALLAGAVTALVGLFCVGLVRDTADTLYLCYCIDKASGEKRREEVFIAFEYDFGQPSRANSRRPPDSVVTRPPASTPQGKGRETIFDAGPSAGASTIPRKVLPATPQQHRQFPQGQRTVPLSSPYPEYDEMTPTLTPGSGKGKGPGKGPVNELPIREEEEDLDPFRRSLVDDEEAQVAVATRVGVGVNNTGVNLPVSGHVARPSLVNVGLGLGHGHRKSSSGGGTAMATGTGGVGKGVGGQARMMTSTQELNMKSQFLMNMRPYGVQDSQASEMESMSASARVGSSGLVGSGSGSSMVKDDRNEDSLSEGEESQLGPGSDFFK